MLVQQLSISLKDFKPWLFYYHTKNFNVNSNNIFEIHKYLYIKQHICKSPRMTIMTHQIGHIIKDVKIILSKRVVILELKLQ